MSTLFDIPATRATDPETSRSAARRITASGTRASHCERILSAIESTPGLTYSELADRCGLQPVQVMRRLADLRSAGLVRKASPRHCAIAKSTCTTWHHTGAST